MRATLSACVLGVAWLFAGAACAEVIGLGDYVQANQGGSGSSGAGAGGAGAGANASAGGAGEGGKSPRDFLDNWGARIPLVVDTSEFTTPLTAFNLPVLVTLDSDTAARVAPDGVDLRITTADGLTLLPCEVERYEPSGRLTMWVQIPNLNSVVNPLMLYLYLDNPSAGTSAMPWTGYGAVYHLAERRFESQRDSTANGLHSDVPVGGALTEVAGIAGKALQFPDGGQISLSNARDELEFATDSFTLSAWVRDQGVATDVYQCPVFNGGLGAATPGYSLAINTANNDAVFFYADASSNVVNPLLGNASGWHHLAVVVDRDPAVLAVFSYVDGQLAPSSPTGITGFGSVVNAAAQPSLGDSSCRFAGTLDEVRFARRALTAAEIEAEFSTLKAGADSFVSLGVIENAQ